jgi:hypothetical protein
MYLIQPHYSLILSTSTFILPILYSYKKNQKALSATTLMALCGSINYWMNPSLELGRNIDLFTSKLSAFIYFFYGYRKIKGVLPKLIGFNNLYIIYRLYNLSCKTFELYQNETWIKYHVFFHMFTTFSKLYVIFWI